MKRVLSLILVLSLVLGMFPATFAEETVTTAVATAGETLQGYGLVQGSNGDLNETGTITRAEMMTMLARLLGKEEEAKAFTLPSGFTDIEGHWNANVIGYAKQANWTSGVTETTFDPQGLVTEQQAATFILRALGYVGTDVYATAIEQAKTLGINTTVATGTSILRGELFSMALKALDVPKKDTEVKLGAVLEIEAYTTPVVVEPVVVAVVIDTAVSLNSKTIEVALDEAGTKVDASVFTLVDGDGKAIVVEKAMFAPWDADMETVLVTAETDLVAGTLYTLTSGTSSANFGGVDADEDEPTVSKVESTDYNEITITFNEAVLVEGLVFTASEKYEGKAELAILSVEQTASDTVVATTADQKDATLYATVIDGVVDLAANELEKEEDKTFTGTEKNSDDQTVNKAEATSSVKVEVYFDVKVDAEAAVVAANYTIEGKYDDSKIVILEAVVLEDGDVTLAADYGKVVELTLATDTKDATLYNLTVENVGTKYGKDLDSDDAEDTFTGIAKDEDAPDTVTVTATSNTEIKVAFLLSTVADDLAADADPSLVTVVEKVSGKALELTFVEIDDNNMIFTTPAQADAVLYEATVAEGIVDLAGNKTDDELTDSFVSLGLSDEITTVTGVNTTAKGTELTLEFNQNHGDFALDVGSYVIDGKIGYPTKVVAHATDDKKVVLTIKNTVLGDLYKITVKNVKNADGVAMDSDGITANFVGTGDAADADPRLEAAVAVDNQTIKLYFDTDVDDIAGITTAANLTITGAAAVTDTNALFYEDVTNPKVLVVTLEVTNDAANVKAAGKNATTGVYKVVYAGTDLDAAYDEVELAPNDKNPTKIATEGLVAIDARTIRVYFNQTVRFVDPAAITIDTNGSTAAGVVAFDTAVSANDEGTQWLLGLTGATVITATGELDVVVAATPDIRIGATGDDNILFSTAAADLALTLAGNTTAAGEITDVSAVMTDEKTMVVYFPESMNEASVEGTLNAYTTETLNPVVAVYKDSTKTVTLTFDTAIATGAHNLTITNSILKNAASTVEVEKASNADLVVEYAGSTKDAAEVMIDDVTVTGQVIVVELSQDAITALDAVVAAAPATNLASYLKITVNGSTVLTAADIASVTSTGGANTNALYTDTLTITVGAGVTLVANTQGEVEFVNTATTDFVGINAENQDANQDAFIFVQK